MKFKSTTQLTPLHLQSAPLAIVLVVCFSALSFFSIFASDQQQAELQDLQAKQIIENERLDLVRRKEAEEITNIGKKKAKVTPTQEAHNNTNSKVCKVIKEVIISGNKQVYSWTINHKFINPWRYQKPDSCFTKADLAKLYGQISNYYLEKGFILARVYFDSTAIAKGILKIVIEEGKLEKVEIHDNSTLNNFLKFRRTSEKFFAFPSLCQDSVVNLHDIEQGIEQINRLNSNNAKMMINPASKAGYSEILIENKVGHLSNLSITTDNSGQQSTGRIKRKASLNLDNLLGINDNIYLNYSQSNALWLFGTGKGFNNEISTDDNSNTRFSKAFFTSTSIPFGYWTLGANYSYSKYLVTTAGQFSLIKTSGNSEAKTYYLDRVLWRSKTYKISLKAELGQNDTDSYIEDIYIPVNSRRTTEANFYFNNTFYNSNGILYFQPKYSRGLTAFGAMKDRRGLTADKPKAQFESFGLYAQSNINFKIPKTTIPINHKLTFDSVKSYDSLYGSDQFSLGGKYTIRGFQESIISADNGYLFRNDLSFRIFDLTPKLLTSSTLFDLGGKNYSINSALSKLRLGIFHDYGYVRNHVIDNPNDEGHMSGAGTVLSFNGKFINWDITYSKGLHSPKYLRSIDNISKDKETIYFSLSINAGLL